MIGGLALLGVLALQPAPGGEADPAAEARGQLEAGLALTASRSLARLLSTGADPSAELVLLAARAHEEAREWPTVRRLLTDRPWLDTLDGGAGRRLLARALLAMDSSAAAVRHYERVLGRSAAPGPPPARDRVAYARALLREDRPAAAAEELEAASASQPMIARWLRLSALQARGEAADTVAAAALARTLLRDPAVPADSVRRELALAAFRAGDPARGLAEAAALGARARAELAPRWTAPARMAAGDTARAREELRAALDLAVPDEEAGRLLIAIDGGPDALRRVAASDVRAGRAERATRLLRRAYDAAPPGERPALALEIAAARFAAGAYREVLEELEPWLGLEPAAPTPDTETLGAMWFLRGRAHYRRDQRGPAVEAWREAARRPGRDAAYASFLIGDVLHDAGDLAAARVAYTETLAGFPTSGFAGTALFRLGQLDLVEGAPTAAAARFADYRRRFAGGNWHRASLYWEARALELTGEAGAARARYAELADDPVGYYGIRAAERLGRDPWGGLPPGPGRLPGAAGDPGAGGGAEAATGTPGHAGLVARMSLLGELGWRGRALAELREARRLRAGSAEERLRLAEALNEAGWTWQGSAIAREALPLLGGAWSDRALRAVHPLPYRGAVESAAARHALDPALVAGLMYRESVFDRAVVSAAGAVGLMQVLPRTGRELAGREGLSEFRPEQLVVPEVNIALGARYLRDLLNRFDSRAAALAAYNAGPHRMGRWREFPEFEAGDEIFAERIPFSETRQYVKAVQAAAYVYHRLYWPEAVREPPPR